MKLYSMKLTPVSKKKARILKAIPGDDPQYPYGMEINFETEQVDKIPALQKAKAGEMVRLVAEGKITGIRINQNEKKKNQTVTVQLQQVGVASKEDYDEAWNDAIKGKK